MTKKTSFLLKILFYVSALLVGSFIGIGLVILNSRPALNAQLSAPAEAQSVIEKKVVAPIGTILQEKFTELKEKPAVSEQKSWEKPAEKPAPTTQVTPQVTTQVKIKSDSTNIEEDSTGRKYYESIMGLCPSQRDKNAHWEDGSRLVSIGLTGGEYDKNGRLTLEQLVALNWNNYKKNGPEFGNRQMLSSLNNVSGFDNTWANSRIAFFIDFEGLFVTWDNSWEDGKPISATTEQMQYLDHYVSEATNYLRWLDATYEAKCPND